MVGLPDRRGSRSGSSNSSFETNLSTEGRTDEGLEITNSFTFCIGFWDGTLFCKVRRLRRRWFCYRRHFLWSHICNKSEEFPFRLTHQREQHRVRNVLTSSHLISLYGCLPGGPLKNSSQSSLKVLSRECRTSPENYSSVSILCISSGYRRYDSDHGCVVRPVRISPEFTPRTVVSG